MESALQQAITDLINLTIANMGSATGFLSEQIPPYIQELLLWYGVKTFIVFVVLALVVISAMVVDYRVWKSIVSGKYYRRDEKEQVLYLGWVLTGCIPRLFFYVIPIANMSFDWLQIWIAPKVWLVEYASGVFK